MHAYHVVPTIQNSDVFASCALPYVVVFVFKELHAEKLIMVDSFFELKNSNWPTSVAKSH
jgi:hypothetical protein